MEADSCPPLRRGSSGSARPWRWRSTSAKSAADAHRPARRCRREPCSRMTARARPEVDIFPTGRLRMLPGGSSASLMSQLPPIIGMPSRWTDLDVACSGAAERRGWRGLCHNSGRSTDQEMAVDIGEAAHQSMKRNSTASPSLRTSPRTSSRSRTVPAVAATPWPFWRPAHRRAKSSRAQRSARTNAVVSVQNRSAAARRHRGIGGVGRIRRMCSIWAAGSKLVGHAVLDRARIR